MVCFNSFGIAQPKTGRRETVNVDELQSIVERWKDVADVLSDRLDQEALERICSQLQDDLDRVCAETDALLAGLPAEVAE
jgi:hypothetical protein